MNESGFGEDVEVGVGGEAIGAEADSDAALEELAERVRRMAERGMRARAVDDGVKTSDILACRQGKVIRVGEEECSDQARPNQ